MKLATVLVNTLPGVPLIYTGEEVANDRRLDLFEKVDVDWNRSRELGEINRKLFHLRKGNNALVRGSMVRLKTRFDTEVYAFARVLDDAPDQIVDLAGADLGVVGELSQLRVVGDRGERIDLLGSRSIAAGP